MFDETGDRLTPSHSRKKGRRLRYYISGRLVSAPRGAHPEAWRLPAEQLERLVADLVRQHFARPESVQALLRDPSASEIVTLTTRLRARLETSALLALIARVDLRPGSIAMAICPSALADHLGCLPERIIAEGLRCEAPFTQRRRGVELKLHLGAAPAEIDRTLVRNVVQARAWLALILKGQSFSEIAVAEDTSNRRVQDLVDLALLAPDLLDAIAEGTQPAGLTTDRLIKSGVPARWADQHAKFVAP